MNPFDTSLLPRRHVVAAGLGALLPSAFATAQAAWPKSMRIVAPYAPGGATDLVARLIATGLAQNLGIAAVVDNKVGAGGNIGAAFVARSSPDGANLLMGAASVSINQTLFPDLTFDILKDFTPVTVAIRVPNVLVVSSELPVRNFADFLAYLKKNTGHTNYGTAGIGSLPHLATELMLRDAGVTAEHIAYRGAAPAASALLAGEIHFILGNLPPLAPFIASGKFRPIAVATASRLKDYPAVAAIAETLPGYEAVSWQCLLAPAGMPKRMLDPLYDEVARILATPDAMARVAQMGAENVVLPPAASAKFLQVEVAKWGALVRKLDLKPT